MLILLLLIIIIIFLLILICLLFSSSSSPSSSSSSSSLGATTSIVECFGLLNIQFPIISFLDAANPILTFQLFHILSYVIFRFTRFCLRPLTSPAFLCRDVLAKNFSMERELASRKTPNLEDQGLYQVCSFRLVAFTRALDSYPAPRIILAMGPLPGTTSWTRKTWSSLRQDRYSLRQDCVV